MIYFILLIYFSFLAIVFDVMGCKSNKKIHFIIALMIMILVAWLRYRVGGDTIGYADEFKEYPKLSQLNPKFFSQSRYMPLWVILNSLGQSLGDFVFVQLIAATIHIGIWGYIARQICPTFLFSQLLIYYIFDFLMFNTEVMREGIAISFFLLSVLSLNRKQLIKMWFNIVIASLFHVFAFPVFLLFYLFYLSLGDRILLSGIICIILAIILIINKDLISQIILIWSDGSENALLHSMNHYAMNEIYGITHFSWKGILVAWSAPIFWIIMLLAGKSVYETSINLQWKIFSSAIWLSILLNICRYSMPITSRFYNYFHFFTSILLILLIVKIFQRVIIQQRVLMYLIFVFIFVAWQLNNYMDPHPLVPSAPKYVRYYPYSSVFDKTLDSHREATRRQEFVQ